MKSIAAVWSSVLGPHAPHQHISSLGEALEKVLFRVLLAVIALIVAAFVLAPGTMKEKAARFAFYHELKHEFDLKPIALFEPEPLPSVAHVEPKPETLAAHKILKTEPAPVKAKGAVLRKGQPVAKKTKQAQLSFIHVGKPLKLLPHGTQVVHRLGVFEGRIPSQ